MKNIIIESESSYHHRTAFILIAILSNGKNEEETKNECYEFCPWRRAARIGKDEFIPIRVLNKCFHLNWNERQREETRLLWMLVDCVKGAHLYVSDVFNPMRKDDT